MKTSLPTTCPSGGNGVFVHDSARSVSIKGIPCLLMQHYGPFCFALAGDAQPLAQAG